MQVDTIFDIWNKQKKIIDQQRQQIFFKERDVFFISMWKNIWWEQDGKWNNFVRPVIIIKSFTNTLFWWIAITTKEKQWIYYHTFDLQYDKGNRVAILSQIRLYDAKRLISKIGTISIQDFWKIRKKLTEFLQ